MRPPAKYTQKLNILLTKDQRARVEEVATGRGQSIGEWLRELIDDALQALPPPEPKRPAARRG